MRDYDERQSNKRVYFNEQSTDKSVTFFLPSLRELNSQNTSPEEAIDSGIIF